MEHRSASLHAVKSLAIVVIYFALPRPIMDHCNRDYRRQRWLHCELPDDSRDVRPLRTSVDQYATDSHGSAIPTDGEPYGIKGLAGDRAVNGHPLPVLWDQTGYEIGFAR
jgi:hypothetical protein